METKKKKDTCNGWNISTNGIIYNKIGYEGTWKIVLKVLTYQFSGFQWNFQFLYFSSFWKFANYSY